MRNAIATLLEKNVPYMDRWLQRVAEGDEVLGLKPDPAKALDLMQKLSEYHIPKLARTEVILEPYTSPVAFYAAYKAKYKEQSYGEAEIFNAEYKKQLLAAINSSFTRRLPTPYSIQ